MKGLAARSPSSPAAARASGRRSRSGSARKASTSPSTTSDDPRAPRREPVLRRRPARHRGCRAPERHGAVRHRPCDLRARPRLQAARARQRLRRGLEPLRLQHRGEPRRWPSSPTRCRSRAPRSCCCPLPSVRPGEQHGAPVRRVVGPGLPATAGCWHDPGRRWDMARSSRGAPGLWRRQRGLRAGPDRRARLLLAAGGRFWEYVVAVLKSRSGRLSWSTRRSARCSADLRRGASQPSTAAEHT